MKKFTELLKEYIQVNESGKTMSEQNEKFNKEMETIIKKTQKS